MSLYATLEFFRSALDGLTCMAYPNQQAQAWVNPPAPGLLYPPQIYIWPTHVRDRRQTAPRASAIAGTIPKDESGFRILAYDVDVWVIALGEPNLPGPTPSFIALIDAVANAIRALTMPVSITDPLTGQETFLVAIGEEMDLLVDPVRALEDQRYLRYSAALGITVWEQLQA